MSIEAPEQSPTDFRCSETTTEVISTVWPFAPSREEPEPAEHAEELLEERPQLTDYDATVDASFPASDPPPSPMAHFGRPSR